jgi:hypothetical protein
MGPRKMWCDVPSGPPKDAFTLVDISFQGGLNGILFNTFIKRLFE